MFGVGLLKVSMRYLDSMTVGRTDHTCVTFKKRSLGDDLEWITDWDYRYTYIHRFLDSLYIIVHVFWSISIHPHHCIISYNNISFTCMVHGTTPPENMIPHSIRRMGLFTGRSLSFLCKKNTRESSSRYRGKRAIREKIGSLKLQLRQTRLFCT